MLSPELVDFDITSLTIAWKRVEGALGYSLRLRLLDDLEWPQNPLTVSSDKCRKKNLLTSKQYVFQVLPLFADDSSAGGGWKWSTTSYAMTPREPAPAAPLAPSPLVRPPAPRPQAKSAPSNTAPKPPQKGGGKAAAAAGGLDDDEDEEEERGSDDSDDDLDFAGGEWRQRGEEEWLPENEKRLRARAVRSEAHGSSDDDDDEEEEDEEREEDDDEEWEEKGEKYEEERQEDDEEEEEEEEADLQSNHSQDTEEQEGQQQNKEGQEADGEEDEEQDEDDEEEQSNHSQDTGDEDHQEQQQDDDDEEEVKPSQPRHAPRPKVSSGSPALLEAVFSSLFSTHAQQIYSHSDLGTPPLHGSDGSDDDDDEDEGDGSFHEQSAESFLSPLQRQMLLPLRCLSRAWRQRVAGLVLPPGCHSSRTLLRFRRSHGAAAWSLTTAFTLSASGVGPPAKTVGPPARRSVAEALSLFLHSANGGGGGSSSDGLAPLPSKSALADVIARDGRFARTSQKRRAHRSVEPGKEDGANSVLLIEAAVAASAEVVNPLSLEASAVGRAICALPLPGLLRLGSVNHAAGSDAGRQGSEYRHIRGLLRLVMALTLRGPAAECKTLTTRENLDLGREKRSWEDFQERKVSIVYVRLPPAGAQPGLWLRFRSEEETAGESG